MTPEVEPARFEVTDQPPAPIVDLSNETESKVQPRLSVAITNDGTLDIERMREKNRKQLVDAVRATLATPEGAKALGVTPEEAPIIFDDEFCGQLYDLLTMVEVPVFAQMLHVDADISAQCFAYTKQEKDVLAHPTAIVLSKWIPSTAAKWKDEVYLSMLLLAIHKVKMESARKLQVARNAEHAVKPVKPNGQDKEHVDTSDTEPTFNG